MASSMGDRKPGFQRSQEQILLNEAKGHVRVITFNNPRKLNIINKEVAIQLAMLYEKWEKEDDVKMILVKGVGRAFSSGGELRQYYYGMLDTNNIETVYKLYWRQYHNHTYKKTSVALVNGLAMGSGASLAVASTFNVVTEKAIFAAPEVRIGFHTDAGLSYILSRLPGHLGEYLALTSSQLNGVEMTAIGLSTYYVPSKKLEELEKRLVDLNTGDRNIIKATIEDFSLHVQPKENSILHNRSLIDNCFSKDTIEEIIQSLAIESDIETNQWVKDIITNLRRSSPISLKMTLQSIRQAREQTLFECLKKEFRLTINIFSGVISNDTYEGIRATIIDKDNSPKWNPPSLGEVTKEKLDLLFKPLKDEFELQLPKDGKISRWEGKYESSGFPIKNPYDSKMDSIKAKL